MDGFSLCDVQLRAAGLDKADLIVILSAAKNPHIGHVRILRCAQNDNQSSSMKFDKVES